jgi:E3 ubiquitin-protein ligase HERC3
MKISLLFFFLAYAQSLVAAPKAVDVVTGLSSSCALFDNGLVKCWGIDQEGSLGTGLPRNDLGDVPGETGDGLPFVNLGQSAFAEDLFAGYFHTCAILASGKTKCWGDNTYGQLGLGDGEDRGRTPETTPNKLPFVDLGVGQVATQIFAGENSTCALLLNNTIKCFGENRRGTLGQGDASNRGLMTSQMGDSLLPIYLGRRVSVQTINVYLTNACAVTTDGLVKCWGANDNSQAGVGNKSTIGVDPQDMGDNLPFVNLGTK